jgi:hypothetical protein
VLGIIIVAALGGAVLLVFSSDGDGGGGGTNSAPFSTESASVNVQFAPTTVNNFSGGGFPAALSPEQVTAIMDTAGKYLDQAVIEPLKTGEAAPDVSALFDPATAAQLSGPARGALFDEGLPRASGGITATAPVVEVSGLSDASGAFVLATVGSTVDIVAETDDGDLTIHRVTDLTLVPDGPTWKISGYKVTVSRQGAGVKNPTAAAEAPR